MATNSLRVVRMQEVKQSFPGNRIIGVLMELTKYLLGAIVLVSVLEWELSLIHI